MRSPHLGEDVVVTLLVVWMMVVGGATATLVLATTLTRLSGA